MRLVIFDGIRYLLDCSQEHFNSILPAIKSDIQMMKDSQTGEQKWFNRESKWKIQEQYGTVTAKVFGPKPEKGKEELKFRDESEYYVPVPVYELWDNNLFKKYWVNLGLFWDSPSVDQDVPMELWSHRDDAEFIDTKAAVDIGLFKLERIAYNNYRGIGDFVTKDESWPDPSQTDSEWSSSSYPGVAELLGDGDWYGPNLAGTYFRGYFGSNDKATIYGDWYLAYSPNVYMWDYEVRYWTTVGGADIVTSIKQDYYFGPSVRTIVDNSSYSINISINDNLVYDSSLLWIMTRAAYLYETGVIIDRLTASFTERCYEEVLQVISGEYLTLIMDIATDDYSSWCIIVDSKEYSNTENTQKIEPCDKYNPDLPNQDVWSYTYKIKAKIADYSDEVIIYEGETVTLNSGIIEYSYCDLAEIYDFFGEPVYTFTIYIDRFNNDTSQWLNNKFVYGMIFKGVLYKSEVFEEISYRSYDVDVYDCSDKFNLYSSVTCRAVGMKRLKESGQTISLEA